jgi:hypothetical protein
MRAALLPIVLVAVIVAAQAVLGAGQPSVVRLEVVGTIFRATLSDGSVRQGSGLVGIVLVFTVNGSSMRVRIAGIRPDPSDKTGSVFLHDFRIADTGKPLCEPAPDGQRTGFPLRGRTAHDGSLLPAGPGEFELICAAGAQGKCVRFGYHPWESTADGHSMRDHYDACVRMVRADYCGDGTGWTRDGMAIDIWDDLGVQIAETRKDPRFSFEAGWTPAGAVCVGHTRGPEHITPEKLRVICPRLAEVVACDEDIARAAGALLYNRSH